jgi:hypothetical protein
MTTDIDREKLPQLAAYLDGLPHGLASHPEAQVKSDSLDPMRALYGAMFAGVATPPALVDALAGRQAGEWMPEVIGNALYLACRDLAFRSDDAFLEWRYESSATTFKTPLYRVIMHIVSPTLVVMGAAKRWAAFHQGSSLKSSSTKRRDGRASAEGRLSYPSGLFPDLVLRGFCRSFEAAIAASHARNPRATVQVPSADEAVYLLSWDG